MATTERTFGQLVDMYERKPLEWLADHLPARRMHSGKMKPVGRHGEAIALVYRRKLAAQDAQQPRPCGFHGMYGCPCGR